MDTPMQFLNSFTLNDVFLVAIGVVTATLFRILYDLYQDQKKIKELDEMVNVYGESMNAYQEGILILSSDDEIRYANSEAKRILGSKDQALTTEMIRRDILLKYPGEDRTITLHDVIEQKNNIAHINVLSGSHNIPVSISLNRFNQSLDGNIVWTIVVLQDITEKLKLKEKAERQGEGKDFLTGLPIKYHLINDVVPAAIRSSENNKVAAIAFFALKDFEKFEYHNGIEKSESIIKSAANKIEKIIDEHDRLYRFHTNSFAILMQNYDNKNDVQKKVEKIFFTIQDLLLDEEIRGNFMKSMYFIEDSNLTALNIVNEAYKRLWKKHVENSAKVYDFDMYDINFKTAGIINKLTKEDFLNAIENKDFFFFYQPIFDLKNNRISGLEILTRFNHRKYGFLNPDDFVPKAIELGVMHKITDNLLENVLVQKKFWENEFKRELSFTINLAFEDLQSRYFVEILQNKLLKHRVDPSTITIDMQESSLDENLEVVIEELNAIEQIGVKICLEHFAKDFTNLKYLEFLPIDKIKIDSSIIARSNQSRHKKRLISIITSIGKALDMKVGAIHVDSLEIKNLIEQAGCDFAQGYYFGKPMPAHEVSELLMKENN